MRIGSLSIRWGTGPRAIGGAEPGSEGVCGRSPGSGGE